MTRIDDIRARVETTKYETAGLYKVAQAFDDRRVLLDLVERAVPFVTDRSVDSEARQWLRDVRGEDTP